MSMIHHTRLGTVIGTTAASLRFMNCRMLRTNVSLNLTWLSSAISDRLLDIEWVATLLYDDYNFAYEP